MSRKLTGGFSTRAVHVGQEPDAGTGAIIPPLYQTTTYAQKDFGVHQGFDYSRAANPSRQMLEENLASLEQGDFGICFASGMAAINALFSRFSAGDHIILSETVYGGTFRLLTKVLNRHELETSWVDSRSLDEVVKAIRSETRAIFIETPTNPMLTLTDIAATAVLAHERGLLCIVDNTFMSPYFQRPLELGADAVVHSTTKYINGHSDVLGGALITRNAELAEELHFIQKSAGAVPSPFDCWITLRSIKTLPLRMQRHDGNGRAVAEFLAAREDVDRVLYPGLPAHPQHELARQQQLDPDGNPGFGGMISFDLGSMARARKFCLRLRLFTLAESLGGVESLISHPATMTHATIPKQKRVSFGLTDGLLRLSVGIEDYRDLEDDLEQALDGS